MDLSCSDCPYVSATSIFTLPYEVRKTLFDHVSNTDMKKKIAKVCQGLRMFANNVIISERFIICLGKETQALETYFGNGRPTTISYEKLASLNERHYWLVNNGRKIFVGTYFGIYVFDDLINVWSKFSSEPQTFGAE